MTYSTNMFWIAYLGNIFWKENSRNLFDVHASPI